MKTLIMTCGNIGTGKSTTVREITASLKPGTYFVWNVDSIAQSLSHGIYDAEIWTAKHKELYDNLKAQLVAGAAKFSEIIVILDDCHMGKIERAKWLKLAKELDFYTILYVHDSQNNVDNRMQSDSRGYQRDLWVKVSNMFAAEWVEPSREEGFDELTKLSF